MYFFPFVGGGKTTILRSQNHNPKHHTANALCFRNSIRGGDESLNHFITIHVLNLPNDAVSPNSSMSASMDTSVLQEPLKLFLTQNPLDCIFIHVFHHLATDVIDGLNIKWVVFNGNGFFSCCISECIGRYGPHEHRSDSEPFLVPQIPDRIVLTKSQLPPFAINKPGFW